MSRKHSKSSFENSENESPISSSSEHDTDTSDKTKRFEYEYASHDLPSRRLVEYFVVITCKPPRIRNKARDITDDQTHQTSNEKSTDDEVLIARNEPQAGEQPSTSPGSPSKHKLLSPKTSRIFKRFSSRMVHLDNDAESSFRLASGKNSSSSDKHLLTPTVSEENEDIAPDAMVSVTPSEHNNVVQKLDIKNLLSEGLEKSDKKLSKIKWRSFRSKTSKTSKKVSKKALKLLGVDDTDNAPANVGDKVILKEESNTVKDGNMIQTKSFTDSNLLDNAMDVTEQNHANDGQNQDVVMTPSRTRAIQDTDASILMDDTEQNHANDGQNQDVLMTPSRTRAIQDTDASIGSNKVLNTLSNTSLSESPKGATDKVEISTPTRPTSDGTSNNIQMPKNEEDDTKSTTKELKLIPSISARYPLKDRDGTPLDPIITQFCFPNGDAIHLTVEYKMPRIHHFVLTNERGKKMYGTCLTFYEEFLDEHLLCEEEIEAMKRASIDDSFDESYIEVSLNKNGRRPTVYIPKVVCILSAWSYLQAFREYLSQLYKLATATNLMRAPIERYVLNICEEIPAPPPGAFEIRIKILSSDIRFWAPPANQPIAYVALPFRVLFECLDINNIIFVWYSLTLERKILLVSSQSSLLTLCAEILCSLLFPMQWSHLYIPIIPVFLSPMLDAPLPYLIGISRECFAYAIGDVSDETIVVDLDKNVITMGDNFPELPPLPTKLRSKLKKALEKHAGETFWQARGFTKADLVNTMLDCDDTMETSIRIWKEKIQTFDDAFNLAYTPDSLSLQYEDNYGGNKQSRWDAVQEAFLRFFVSVLKDYRRFLPQNDEHLASIRFQINDFISSQRHELRPFLEEFCLTQKFDNFVTKRIYQASEPDVIFFDKSITAKKNRSKMTIKKKDTTFLHSANAHKALRIVDAHEPTTDGLEGGFDMMLINLPFLSSTRKQFCYESWPSNFKSELFNKPRDIPEVIAKEFDRREEFLLSHSSSKVTANDFESGPCHPSIEIATSTLFFTIFCELIGKELILLRKKYSDINMGGVESEGRIENPDSRPVLGNVDVAPFGTIPDCALDVCSSCIKPSKSNKMYFGSSSGSDDVIENSDGSLDGSLLSNHTENIDIEIDEAKLIAKAELDFAFSTFDTMRLLRKLPIDIDAYKSLMMSCGRCGDTRRATLLMELVKSDGHIVDSEMYSRYLTAFSVANEITPDGFLVSPLANVPSIGVDPDNLDQNIKSKRKQKRTISENSSTDCSDSKSNSNSSLSLSPVGPHDTFSNDPLSYAPKTSSTKSSTNGESRLLHRYSATTSSKGKKLMKTDALPTTEQVKKHIAMGKELLHYLYHDLKLDLNSDACPKCSFVLEQDVIMLGWKPTSFHDTSTKCPQCGHTFIARFRVSSTKSEFLGSEGAGTPLYCDYLSPWMLRKMLCVVTSGEQGTDIILDPSWRDADVKNASLFWNLVVLFKRFSLPYTWLLQGSFKNRLIMPMPED